MSWKYDNLKLLPICLCMCAIMIHIICKWHEMHAGESKLKIRNVEVVITPF